MSSAHESLSHTEAERLLASLAGVVSASVLRDSAGRIAEIHILSAAELHPKQVVRNVESALSAGLGIEVDRRIISVAQIRTPTGPEGRAPGRPVAYDVGDPDGGDDVPALVTPEAPARNGTRREAIPVRSGDDSSVERARLQYVRFQARRDAERCACEVVLRDGDTEIVGTGSGPDTAAGRSEAAARAVLAAIEQARPDLRLQLEGAVISASRGRSYVIVSARALLDRSSVPLAGAAPLARSPEEAGILATLQATNRWSG